MRQKPHPGNKTQGFIDLDILRLKKKTHFNPNLASHELSSEDVFIMNNITENAALY